MILMASTVLSQQSINEKVLFFERLNKSHFLCLAYLVLKKDFQPDRSFISIVNIIGCVSCIETIYF